MRLKIVDHLMLSEALVTAIVRKELALGGVWVTDLNLFSWSLFEFIGEAEWLSLPTFFCLKGLCFASQPRETGRCSDSKQLFLLSASTSHSYTHPCSYLWAKPCYNSSPATFSIEQKFPKPWELKEVHLLEQLSTSKVAEQLQYLDWAQGWLQWGVTVSGL